MQQHVYTTSKAKIFKQSFFIWLFVFTQVAMNIYGCFFYQNTEKILVLLFLNAVVSIITIPSLYLFFNYYKYSVNKELTITYDFVRLTDKKTKKQIELQSNEIEKIEFYMIPYSGRSPYGSYEYFCLIDKSAKKIIITFHILSIADFWCDELTRKISSKKLVKTESIFPGIKL